MTGQRASWLTTANAASSRRLADEPITLEELADEFGVSRERVRQIEARAFEKVQKAVKTNVADTENPEHAAPAAMR